MPLRLGLCDGLEFLRIFYFVNPRLPLLATRGKHCRILYIPHHLGTLPRRQQCSKVINLLGSRPDRLLQTALLDLHLRRRRLKLKELVVVVALPVGSYRFLDL